MIWYDFNISRINYSCWDTSVNGSFFQFKYCVISLYNKNIKNNMGPCSTPDPTILGVILLPWYWTEYCWLGMPRSAAANICAAKINEWNVANHKNYAGIIFITLYPAMSLSGLGAHWVLRPQRAPMRTQVPSMGTGHSVPRILLASAIPFHSSRDCPSATSVSIHGIKLCERNADKRYQLILDCFNFLPRKSKMIVESKLKLSFPPGRKCLKKPTTFNF